MDTQDAGAEVILRDTVHTGTQSVSGRNIVHRPTYDTRRGRYAPHRTRKRGRATTRLGNPPNEITPTLRGYARYYSRRTER